MPTTASKPKVLRDISLRGDRIRKWREFKGLSQQELSKLCGLTRLAIYRYERNESDPSTENLLKIARVLNLSIDYLLGLSEISHPTIPGDSLTERERKLLLAWREHKMQAAMSILVKDFEEQEEKKAAAEKRKFKDKDDKDGE